MVQGPNERQCYIMDSDGKLVRPVNLYYNSRRSSANGSSSSRHASHNCHHVINDACYEHSNGHCSNGHAHNKIIVNNGKCLPSNGGGTVQHGVQVTNGICCTTSHDDNNQTDVSTCQL